MGGLFKIDKVFVLIKKQTNKQKWKKTFKLSSILALQKEKKKLTSSYIYQVLAGKRKVIRILKEEESQSI